MGRNNCSFMWILASVVLMKIYTGNNMLLKHAHTIKYIKGVTWFGIFCCKFFILQKYCYNPTINQIEVNPSIFINKCFLIFSDHTLCPIIVEKKIRPLFLNIIMLLSASSNIYIFEYLCMFICILCLAKNEILSIYFMVWWFKISCLLK